MATQQPTTSQEQFFKNLNEMLTICVFSEGSINDEQLLEIASKYTDQYKVIKNLLDENAKLRELARTIQANRYYIRNTTTKKQKVLTLEEKAKSEVYSHCELCDNIIKDTYHDKHMLNWCCSNNQLKKEVAKKGLPVHTKYNKATQLINMYIRICVFDKNKHNNKRNGAYWKTIELMKYNYL